MSDASIQEYQNRLRDALAFIGQLKSKLEGAQRAKTEPIAIIGMGCRFPGGGVNPDVFFRALENGVDGIRSVPEERWPADALPDDHPEIRWVGLIDSIDDFDAAFFEISPREALSLDPQQRLLLEIVWEALEDAGQRPDRLKGSPTGVFVGLTTLDYQQRCFSQPPELLDGYAVTGNMASTAAGRISFTLGLQGPCMAIDTACSSSLVAIHLACQSLRNHETDLAISGGVNIILAPLPSYLMAQLHALAPDGRCKTFDARANGYVRGEGCGIIVLKRLSDAVRDGDRILAVLRGSGINQDGRSTGLTTPNVLAQESLLRQVLAAAKLSAQDIGYVETHGTGTPLGDPIEIDAIRSVFGDPRPDGTLCILGAVKTNLGHLEAAAGVAGVIKAVQALRHDLIPKNLHFQARNPRIDIEGTPLTIPTTNTLWPRGTKPRRVGVSGFGISGTNAHVILEEAPAEKTTAPAKGASAYLLPLSAKTPQGLSALAEAYAQWFSGEKDVPLQDVTYTASARRMHHEHRLAAVARTREEFANILGSFARGQTSAAVTRGRANAQTPPKVVFIFPGQGSQWIGMGRQLIAEEPIFRATIEMCEPAIRNEAGFSLLEQIAANEAQSRLAEIDVVQPLLFAIQVALAALWRSWGIEPDCVVGHSMGEVAAAHIAGMLSLDDAAKVICRRSRLLKRISGHGAMGLVELPMAEAEVAIAGYESRLGIAVSNGPRSTVVSGDPGALEEVLATLEANGIFCRRVKVDVASHSPQVDPLQGDLLDALRDVRPTSGKLPMRSTVTGKALQGSELIGRYWSSNLREPVRFSQVTQDLMREGHHIFVEISPHPILLPSIEENMKWALVDGSVVASMRRDIDARRTMLEALGSLYAQGRVISWDNHSFERGHVVALPNYPWQRQRYWIDAPKKPPRRTHMVQEHPLLGTGFVLASQPEVHVWEQSLSVKAFPYLADHRVQGEVVFPGAGYVEMAFAAAGVVYGEAVTRLEEITFEQMLALPHDEARIVQVSMHEENGGRGTITISSKQDGARDWVRHAFGTVRVLTTSTAHPATAIRTEVESRCPETVAASQHYERMEARGLSYGKTFQGVTDVRFGMDEAMARVRLPNDAGQDAKAYLVHPALLDACLQAALWSMHSSMGEGTFVPVKASGVRLFERPERDVWVHGRRTKDAKDGAPATSIMVYDDTGRILLEISELLVRQLVEAKASEKDAFADCIFEVAWQKRGLAETQTNMGRVSEPWLVLMDAGGLGAALVERLRTRGERVVEVVSGNDYAHVDRNVYRLNPTSSEHWNKLLASAFGKLGCRGAIYCGALDGAPWRDTSEATITTDLQRGPWSTLRLTQALVKQGWRDTPKLYVLTRAAQTVGMTDGPLSVAQSTLWGLGRVIAMEQPDLGCIRIDLPADANPNEVDFLVSEITAGGDEDQVAFRVDGRYVARLVRGSWAKNGAVAEKSEPAAGRPYRLEIREPGILDRLGLRPMERAAPGPGEVEIEVEAAGLNFLDVLLAMGVLPDDTAEGTALGPRLGGECAGRIVRLGEGISDLKVGLEVIALAPSAMATHVIAKRALVIPKPSGMSWTDAATVPIVFLTMYYSLRHVARLQKGERVLIHAGAGGVGMAAIQWAKHVGAEIFVTAGSLEKRALLKNLGVDHVMDSRSLTFVDDVLRITNGEGVDVVLNSLSGKLLDASFELLRDHGRFVEIGKRDYYENRPLGLRPFLKNLSFSLVDLRGMMFKRPNLVASLLKELVALFDSGTLKPVSCQVFFLSKATEAFVQMAQGKHIGKLALAIREQDARITFPVAVGAEIRSDATYLITGGLGALGLSLAKWMIEQGAKYLALVGRHAPTAAAETAIGEMRAAGATVCVLRGNVARSGDLDVILAQIDRDMLPLRGVVHAAGLLDDKTITEMRETEFYHAMEPKVFGGWNLHQATRHRPLDFFVVYSSAAGLLGSPGQANYAAANTFLDALCHARVADGLPATSIEWGAFADIGLAAAKDDRGKRLASRGSESFKPEDGGALFARVIAQARVEVALMRFDVRQWVEFYPQMAGAPFFTELANDKSDHTEVAKQETFRDLIEPLAPAQRLDMIEAHLLQQLGKVLRLEAGHIDKRTPFTNLGMDSLMSLELRNRLESSLGLKLSAALLFTYSTTFALANHLAERLLSAQSSREKNNATATPTSASIDDANDVDDTNDVQNLDEPTELENDSTLVDRLGEFEDYLK